MRRTHAFCLLALFSLICVFGCQAADKKKSAPEPKPAPEKAAPQAKSPGFGAETPEVFGQMFCDFNIAPDADKFAAMAHPKLLDVLLTSIGQAKGGDKPYTLDDMKQEMKQQLETEKPYTACEITDFEQTPCNQDAVAGYDKELGLALQDCGTLTAHMTGADGNAGQHPIPILNIQGRWVIDLLGSSGSAQRNAQ